MPSLQTTAVALSTEKRDRLLVNLFLQNYNQGEYAVHRLDWINHSQYKDVEVIAENATGERLAIEHTLLENFPRVWEKEQSIKNASRQLREDAGLRVPGRNVWVFLPAETFDRDHDSFVWRWSELDEALVCWARASFSALLTGDSTHNILVPTHSGKSRSLNIKTSVSETRGSPGTVSVHGLFPEDPNAEAMRYLCPELQRAIQKKVPKLRKTVDDKRAGKAVLLLELHGVLIHRNSVMDELRADSQIRELDAVALVYTSGIKLKGEVRFFVWHPCSNEWDIPWTVSLTAQHP